MALVGGRNLTIPDTQWGLPGRNVSALEHILKIPNRVKCLFPIISSRYFVNGNLTKFKSLKQNCSLINEILKEQQIWAINFPKISSTVLKNCIKLFLFG